MKVVTVDTIERLSQSQHLFEGLSNSVEEDRKRKEMGRIGAVVEVTGWNFAEWLRPVAC